MAANIKYIEQLLDKYWEGNSSLKEEQQLKTFFSQANIPEHLQTYQALFQYLQYSQQQQLTDTNFEADLLKQQQQFSKIRYLPSTTSIVRALTSIAACLLMTVGLYYYNSTSFINKPTTAIVDTYQNPDEAYAKTQQVLLLMSQKLNKGTHSLQHLEKFNEVKKVLNSSTN